MNSQINYNRFSVTSEMDNSSQRLMKKMQSAVPADCIVNLNISKENSDYVAIAKFKGPSLEAVIRKTSPDYFEALNLVSADFENRVPLWSEAFQSNPIRASRREQTSETSSLSRSAATEPTTSFQRAQPKDLKGAEQRAQKLMHKEEEGRAGNPKSQPTQQQKATRNESGKSGKQQPTTGTRSREQHQQYKNI